MAKKRELLKTFYGNASVTRDTVYDCSGRVLSSSVDHRDLETQRPKKPDPEFIDERSPDYKRVEQLPFVHLLSNEGSSEPIATSFCEIVRHSDTWNGKQVRFRASVISDGIDHTALAAAECSGRIIPRISEGAGNRPDVQAFTRCLFLDKPRGTAFKHVSAVFAGKFVWDQTTRVLEVEEVNDLRVNPKKNMP